jgi:hypothetical protein
MRARELVNDGTDAEKRLRLRLRARNLPLARFVAGELFMRLRPTRARMKILEAQVHGMNARSVILSRPIENPRPDDGERAVAASATRSLDSAELSRAKESATCAVERSLLSARRARFKRF